MTANVILVQAAPRRTADGVAETVRLAGGGAKVPYYYAGQHWRAGITAQPRTITSIGYSGTELGTGGVPQALVVSWSPSTRAQLNAMSALFWVDAAISIWCGAEGADPPLLLSGVVLDVAAEDGTLQIAMADPAANLKKPVLLDRFGGTGGADGPAEWAGRIRRRGWGRLFNVIGDPIDPPNNIYCYGDPARGWQAFDAVRDAGAAADAGDLTLLAWQGSVAATFAALQAAVATEGGGVLCPSIACIKWWTLPSGDLCVDARGEAVDGYVETAPEIAGRIIASRSGLSFAAGTLAAAVAARPAIYGHLADDENITIAETLDQILGDVSLLWAVSNGAIVLRRWQWTAPVASGRSQQAKRVKVHKPIGTRRLGYQRNRNKMTRGEIAGEVLSGLDAINNVNRVRNSQFPRLAGWGALYVQSGLSQDSGFPAVAAFAGKAFVKQSVTSPGAGYDFSLGQPAGYFVPVKAGERLSVRVGIEGQGSVGNQVLAARFWTEAGTIHSTETMAGLSGPQPLGTRIGDFVDVPVDGLLQLELYCGSSGPGTVTMVITEPMVATATASQIDHPPYTPGPQDGADGDPGDPGDPGEPGYAIAPAASPLQVQCNAAGVPLVDELPQSVTLTLLRGDVDLSTDAATDFSLISSDSAGSFSFSGTNDRTVTVTSAPADSFSAIVGAYRSGVLVQQHPISVRKVKNGAAAASDYRSTTSWTNASSSSYGSSGSGSFEFSVGNSGNIAFDVSIAYYPSVSSGTMVAKVQERIFDTGTSSWGAWTDISGEFVGTLSAPGEPGEINVSFSHAITSASIRSYKVLTRRQTGSGALTTSGTFAGTYT